MAVMYHHESSQAFIPSEASKRLLQAVEPGMSPPQSGTGRHLGSRLCDLDRLHLFTGLPNRTIDETIEEKEEEEEGVLALP